MLATLVDFMLRFRWAVLTVAGALVALGILAALRLPFDAFPDTTPALVQVNVSAPGWAPEDLERLVTYPVEQSVTGLTGLTEVRSVTKYGLCQVTALFDDNTELYLARQQVSEKLTTLRLPEGVGAPELGPVSTGLGEIFHYIVVSDSSEKTVAREAQDWDIKPQLLAAAGVAEINSWGGFKKQFLITLDPGQTAKFKLTFLDVIDAIHRELGVAPGGQIIRGGEMTLVRGSGIVGSLNEIEEIVVASRDGLPIFVRDVASVSLGHEIRRGAATYNGQGEATLGLGFMIIGENPAQVTNELARRLEAAQESLPEGVTAIPVYQRT
ncbi:MAG TPA: efflux RND transporter permease subunit, partial [candidate division Zixibacteria bacterium]|nr:efflux RND transporter permease subunit [candidate division Zixibacteria bacterium]